MNQALVKISTSLISDILSCFGIPTAMAQSVYDEVMERRKKEAMEILLSEIRQGQFQNVDGHEAISVVERYLRAAVEGTAKQNLRLLAQVIRGMANNKILKAPSFIKYAGILGTLTEDEIRLLGIMIGEEESCYESCKKAIHQHFSAENAKRILQSLLRTGLVCFTQGLESEYKERQPDEERDKTSDTIRWIENDFWTNYELTSLMQEIVEYTKFFSDEELAT